MKLPKDHSDLVDVSTRFLVFYFNFLLNVGLAWNMALCIGFSLARSSFDDKFNASSVIIDFASALFSPG